MIIQKITLHGYGIESHHCMDDCDYFKLENNQKKKNRKNTVGFIFK